MLNWPLCSSNILQLYSKEQGFLPCPAGLRSSTICLQGHFITSLCYLFQLYEAKPTNLRKCSGELSWRTKGMPLLGNRDSAFDSCNSEDDRSAALKKGPWDIRVSHFIFMPDSEGSLLALESTQWVALGRSPCLGLTWEWRGHWRKKCSWLWQLWGN